MQPITKVISPVGVAIFLNACTNALYFYETDKVSFTVEARPDSSQPVQGNFGLKQRVALISPPKKYDESKLCEDPKECADGDALSSISSFRIDIKEENWQFNPINIRTAFITGDAAKGLDEQEAALAAQAISGAQIATHSSTANKIIKRLENDNRQSLQRIQTLCKKTWDELTTNKELEELGEITGQQPYRKKEALHKEICKIIKDKKVLTNE